MIDVGDYVECVDDGPGLNRETYASPAIRAGSRYWVVDCEQTGLGCKFDECDGSRMLTLAGVPPSGWCANRFRKIATPDVGADVRKRETVDA